MSNTAEYIRSRAEDARAAARILASVSTSDKNRALLKMADDLVARADEIIAENKKDLSAGKERGLSDAMLDRLMLDNPRIEAVAAGLREIAALPDPVGEVVKMWNRPNGMTVGRMRVPIGVIGFIYESRPNVTADAAALCLKAGNAVILKGGSEAIHSNIAIRTILAEALEGAGLPSASITLVDRTDREAVMELLKLDDLVDLVIPRGGEGLIRAVAENARMPVLKHYKGVCHVYIDGDADPDLALKIAVDSKCQRPGVCNAAETLLVDRALTDSLLPKLLAALKDQGVQLKGCAETVKADPDVAPAADNDYHTEHLALAMNVRVVDGLEGAKEHIAQYGSGHTETIVTKDYEKGLRFLREVDSSAVMVNASTRLNDGFEFGLGAEIGISTNKIHARGPMGLEELTCTKFIVFGTGQVK